MDMEKSNNVSAVEASGSLAPSEYQDDAAAYVGYQSNPIDHNVAERARRKIDFFFVPTLMLGYGLVYYDKAILGSAVLFGMDKDLELSVVVDPKKHIVSTDRLSWATSVFYFGMLAGLYPMSLILQRFRFNRVLCPLVILWGAIAMLTATVKTWQGLYAQRFFLGFIESVVPTAMMTIVAAFYTQREQSFRQSAWFSANGLFTIVGGALSYGFGSIHHGDLRRWQYIYLFAGAITVLFGIFCFFVPDSPMEAWFLTKEERYAAVERLRNSQTGVRSHKINFQHALDIFKDPKYYLVFLLMASAYTMNGAVSGFGPLIVSTFGWSTLDSILFQFPLGGVSFFVMLFSGWVSSRYRNLIIFQMVLYALPVIAGCALIWKSTWSYHAEAPVWGFALIGFFGPVVSLIIVLGMSNVAGATKKSLMAANIFVAYTVGNIVGPQLIKSQTKNQHYPELWKGMIICYCIVIATAITTLLHLRRLNKKRDAAMATVNQEEKDATAFQNLTDNTNPYFRYVY